MLGPLLNCLWLTESGIHFPQLSGQSMVPLRVLNKMERSIVNQSYSVCLFLDLYSLIFYLVQPTDLKWCRFFCTDLHFNCMYMSEHYSSGAAVEFLVNHYHLQHVPLERFVTTDNGMVCSIFPVVSQDHQDNHLGNCVRWLFIKVCAVSSVSGRERASGIYSMAR